MTSPTTESRAHRAEAARLAAVRAQVHITTHIENVTRKMTVTARLVLDPEDAALSPFEDWSVRVSASVPALMEQNGSPALVRRELWEPLKAAVRRVTEAYLREG